MGAVTDFLGRGPFDRSGSLTDPRPGEHYRVVFGSGWMGTRKTSRMDAYALADLLEDIDKAAWQVGTHYEDRVIGVVRVIPQTSSLHERLTQRGLRS